MARRPRWYRTDAAYCDVQRTVDRQFLFRPDTIVRNIIGSSAARAKRKYPVKLYWIDFNINHRQTGRAPISDNPEHLDNLVKFDRLFSSLVAREINRYLDREGPLYSSRTRTQEATDDFSLERQLFYAVTNPVKDGLVDRTAHWQSIGGQSSYNQLATGQVDQYTYIDRGAWHRAGGSLGKKPLEQFVVTINLELDPIPAWKGMSPHKRQALFRRRVRQLEQEYRNEREREHRGVVGKTRLRKLDPRSRPKMQNPRTPQPLCHASSVEAADEYKKGWLAFLDQFYYSSGMYLAGKRNVDFPSGSFRPPLIQLCV